MKRRRFATTLIIAGVLLLVAAAGLAAFNMHESRQAGSEAAAISAALMKTISDTPADAGDDPMVRVDGADYIGILEIPDLGISLPVRADYAFDLLQYTPCRYSGTCKGNDLVICGHNYTSHFGPLLGADIGSDVYLTTADGRVHHYTIANREELEPTAVEEMVERENGDWDLTLFTCTMGGQTRCAVRCTKAADDVAY